MSSNDRQTSFELEGHNPSNGVDKGKARAKRSDNGEQSSMNFDNPISDAAFDLEERAPASLRARKDVGKGKARAKRSHDGEQGSMNYNNPISDVSGDTAGQSRKSRASEKLKHMKSAAGRDQRQLDERTELADATFQRIFNIIDHTSKRQLREEELDSGLHLVKRTWLSLLDIYPPTQTDSAGRRVPVAGLLERSHLLSSKNVEPGLHVGDGPLPSGTLIFMKGFGRGRYVSWNRTIGSVGNEHSILFKSGEKTIRLKETDVEMHVLCEATSAHAKPTDVSSVLISLAVSLCRENGGRLLGMEQNAGPGFSEQCRELLREEVETVQEIRLIEINSLCASDELTVKAVESSTSKALQEVRRQLMHQSVHLQDMRRPIIERFGDLDSGNDGTVDAKLFRAELVNVLQQEQIRSPTGASLRGARSPSHLRMDPDECAHVLIAEFADGPDRVDVYTFAEEVAGGLRADQAFAWNMMESLVALLCDEYLTQIVLPFAESWLEMHGIFDFKRTRVVCFSEMKQGLATACSPDIDIVDDAVVVAQLLESMKLVCEEARVREHVVGIAKTFSALPAKYPSAVRHMREGAGTPEWRKLTTLALDKIDNLCFQLLNHSSSDIQDVDKTVYGLRICINNLYRRQNDSPSLIMQAATNREEAGKVKGGTGARQVAESLRHYADEMRTLHQVCTDMLASHEHVYSAEVKRIVSETKMQEMLQALIIRKRVKTVAGLSRSHKQKKGADADLIKFVIGLQAAARGSAVRRQYQMVPKVSFFENQKSILRAKREAERHAMREKVSLKVEQDLQVAYIDWLEVLLTFIKVYCQTSVDKAVAALQLGRLKSDITAELDTDEVMTTGEAGDEDAGDYESIRFPEVLLVGSVLKGRIQRLRSTLHNWQELLMMLDRTESGYLSPLELRFSLMAFAEMGIITESRELQPLNGRYAGFRYRFTINAAKVDNSSMYVTLGHKSQKVMSQYTYRNSARTGVLDVLPPLDVHKNAVKQGQMRDLPLHIGESNETGVVLLGHEGVPIQRNDARVASASSAMASWACRLEFKWQPATAKVDADQELWNYSVLVSSYRNNAIVVKRTPGKDGDNDTIQLVFMRKEVFNAPSETASLMVKQSKDPLMIITPPIEVVHGSWYYLQLQGERRSLAVRERHSTSSRDRPLRMCVRIDDLTDPIDDVGGGDRITPMHCNEWIGMVDFKDIYSLGNVYDNVCSDAGNDVQWTFGPLRAFEIFGLDRVWMNAGDEIEEHAVMRTRKDKHGKVILFGTAGAEDMDAQQEGGKIIQRVYRDKVVRSPGGAGDIVWMQAGDISATGTGELASGHRSANTKNSQQKDLRTWLNMASRAPGGIIKSRHGLVVIRGKYQLVGIPVGHIQVKYTGPDLRTKDASGGDVKAVATNQNIALGSAYLHNNFNVDHEPGFPFSNAVINRRSNAFLTNKRQRTTDLIVAMLEAIPDAIGSSDQKIWELDDNVELDSNAMFVMRGKTSLSDPGLNVLFTGAQMRAAIRHMNRRLKVNKNLYNVAFRFFAAPIFPMMKHVCKKTDHNTESNPLAGTGFGLDPYETVMFTLRRSSGRTHPPPGREKQSKRRRLLAAAMILVAFLQLAFVVCARFYQMYLVEPRREPVISSIEPLLALVYHLWAAFMLALEVSNLVAAMPSDTPFELAYKKAEVSTMPCVLTRIDDGVRLSTTCMGFVQLACRLHPRRIIDGEEDEEEDEDDDEDESYLELGRDFLQIFWQQDGIDQCLPWLQDERGMTRLEKRTQLQRSIIEFETAVHVHSNRAWHANNQVAMMGMSCQMDLGSPTMWSELVVMSFAACNACVGVLHRWSQGSQTITADLDGCIVVACMLSIFTGSAVVYRSLFAVGCKWYMCLLYMRQFTACMNINGATKDHLPCYMDLRHEGNLESWYTSRDYFDQYCMVHAFGLKAQLIVGSALLVAGGISFNAITTYFSSSESGSVDWTDPGGLISLLNMMMLGTLLFVALMGMERLNYESVKLLRRLEAVSIEVTKTSAVNQSVHERVKTEEAQRANEEQDKKAAARKMSQAYNEQLEKGRAKELTELTHDDAVTTSTRRKDHAELVDGLHGMLQGIDEVDSKLETVLDVDDQIRLNTETVLKRQELEAENAYMHTIIAELRDHAREKMILGIVIDRSVISRLFGAMLAVIYLATKEIADEIIDHLSAYAPPGVLGATSAGDDVQAEGKLWSQQACAATTAAAQDLLPLASRLLSQNCTSTCSNGTTVMTCV